MLGSNVTLHRQMGRSASADVQLQNVPRDRQIHWASSRPEPRRLVTDATHFPQPVLVQRWLEYERSPIEHVGDSVLVYCGTLRGGALLG